MKSTTTMTEKQDRMTREFLDDTTVRFVSTNHRGWTTITIRTVADGFEIAQYIFDRGSLIQRRISL